MSQPLKLIVEQPNYELEFIQEHANPEAPKKLYALGDMLMINRFNKNNRAYPEDDMLPEINRYLYENEI